MVNLVYNFYAMNNKIVLENIKNNLIISCQAACNEPLYEKSAMFALIDTLILLGKSTSLRLAGKRDITYVKEKYPNVTVVGITKPDIIPDNYKELVYITPDIEHVKIVVEAGADIIAFDGTVRNKNVEGIINHIHSFNKLAMADIADFDDAKYSYLKGADILSTTLSGYTKSTENLPDVPDFELLEKLVKTFNVPVILEGKIWNNKDVKHAFELGAHSVVIGSAVTRPHKIIEKFREGIL